MAAEEFELAEAPAGPRDRELWMQHAAGFILFQDVREYARRQIAPDLDATGTAAALKGIDDALYGLMMVLDGVTGGLQGHGRQLVLRTSVLLETWPEGETIGEIDAFHGDGFCMAYHGSLQGDFGTDRVATTRPSAR